MTAVWWTGLGLALLGAFAPRSIGEPAARRIAGVGVFLLLADALRALSAA